MVPGIVRVVPGVGGVGEDVIVWVGEWSLLKAWVLYYLLRV